jgi:hypothetical protein
MKILDWQYEALVRLEGEKHPVLTLGDAFVVAQVDDQRWSKLVMRNLVEWSAGTGWGVTAAGKRAVNQYETPATPEKVRLSPRQWETLTIVVDPDREHRYTQPTLDLRATEKLEERGMIQRTGDIFRKWASTDYGRRVWLARHRPELMGLPKAVREPSHAVVQ